MVTAPLCPLFRPPPDPPPCKFLPLASLSLVTPPEPPDPPDVPAVVALLRYLNTSSSLFPLAMTQNPDLDFPSLTPESRGCDVPFLLLGVSSVVFGCIFSIPSTQAFTQISTLKPPSRMATKNGGGGGSPVSASDTSLTYGFLSPVEEKFIVLFKLWNMEVAGYGFPLVPQLNQSSFLIFPPIWSELDEHVSLVLQGSSSHRMLSAYGAVCVVLRVTLDAIFEEAYDFVVIRFHMILFYDLYRHFIPYVIVVVCLAVNSLFVSSSSVGA
ncbi:hypothetical protein IGI04_032441 [Brassica rapa subsp. trilocularis]|uniref:Uncharacterized protein n=1 Tax=Brassica rapa subsp. trilocularis TaxID=1813537 RepID=A0ABQ7LWH2_BRACM|nr:hypothetical protein IGI04_032441 [Brassica rapa subsp. trilocularis]